MSPFVGEHSSSVAGGRFLETAEAKAFLGRRLFHLREQVVDRLVAPRGDAVHPGRARGVSHCPPYIGRVH